MDRLEHADRTRLATSEEPPTLTNGSVMPVTGAMPIVMPTLTKIWNRSANDDAGGHDRGERVAGDRDDLQPSPDDEQVEEQEHRGAEEAALLGERAKAKSVACSGR